LVGGPISGAAMNRWRDLRMVVDESLCVIDMATLLDPAEPDVRAAADAAREILVRLRAKPVLERLDAAMARKAMARKATAAMPEPEPLLDRTTV
jgi:hypothetical protein